MNSAQGIIGEMKTPKRTPMLKSRGTSNAKIMGQVSGSKAGVPRAI